MYQKYLVTGVLQPVGRLLAELLVEEGKSVRVLVPPESDTKSIQDLDVEIFEGEIFDKDSMKKFFTLDDPRHSALIHTEELVSISDETNISMRRINVTGSNNVIDQCIKSKIGRIVCLGSAYAINPKSARENSVMSFDRTKVEGDYAKTKAEAAAYVMEKVSLNKLNASLLLPTFIIGPGFDDDYDMNKILKSYIEKGVSPVKGGHAFVDVRDVAVALSALCEEGQAGGSYVLNGEHKNTEDFFKDVSKANGSDTPVKLMPKWMMGKTFGKFVDTYYRIAKKDNPKEVYALFMNAPDQTFDSTVNEMLPNGQVRTIYESIEDVIKKVKVDVGDLVQKPAVDEEDEVEEAAEVEAEASEEINEDTPKEEEKTEPEAPKSILNIPSVLGTLSAMSLKKDEPKEEEAKEEIPETVAEEETSEDEAPEVASTEEVEAVEEETTSTEEEDVEAEEVAETEEATEEVVDEAPVEDATEEATEEEAVEEVVAEDVATEEIVEEAPAEVAEAEPAEEEPVQEDAPVVPIWARPIEEEETVEEPSAEEEDTEKDTEEVAEETPTEEVAEAEPAKEEPVQDDAPVVPIWARPMEGNIDSLDDLDDLY